MCKCVFIWVLKKWSLFCFFLDPFFVPTLKSPTIHKYLIYKYITKTLQTQYIKLQKPIESYKYKNSTTFSKYVWDTKVNAKKEKYFPVIKMNFEHDNFVVRQLKLIEFGTLSYKPLKYA